MRRNPFTLIEIVIAVGLLGFFLFACGQVLISTLKVKSFLDEEYARERTNSVGWNIVYQDLSNAIGVYFLDTGVVTAAVVEEKKEGEAAAPPPPGRQHSADRLLTFDADKQTSDEPFLALVVSQGRMREQKNGELGFRFVRYFIDRHPEGEGQILLRSEEAWKPGGKKSGEGEVELPDDMNLLQEYRRFAVLDGFDDMILGVYNGEEWVDQWDSLEKGDLPLALRFEYRLTSMPLGADLPPTVKMAPIPISMLTLKEPLAPL